MRVFLVPPAPADFLLTCKIQHAAEDLCPGTLCGTDGSVYGFSNFLPV